MLRQLVRPQISTCDVFISSVCFWRVRLQLSRFSVNFAHLVTALANPGYARSSICSYKDCIISFSASATSTRQPRFAGIHCVLVFVGVGVCLCLSVVVGLCVLVSAVVVVVVVCCALCRLV